MSAGSVREKFWFWFGVALQYDNLTVEDMENVRAGAEVVLNKSHFSGGDLEDATLGFLNDRNPYTAHLKTLAWKMWSTQFDTKYTGSAGRYLDGRD